MNPITECKRQHIETARARYTEAEFAEYIRGAVDMNGPLQLPLDIWKAHP